MNKFVIITGLMWMLVMGMAQAGTVTYVYTDTQGTPVMESDAQGNITAQLDYTPYGTQALGSPPDGPGYTGHVNDPDTGLVYMQARYYDPEVGSFLSLDPVGPTPGDLFAFNRYAYAGNNPVMRTDPDGRKYAELYAAYGATGGVIVVAGASVAFDAVSGGINVAATPIEVGAGGVAGGYIGLKIGQLADWLTGNNGTAQESRSKPPPPLPEADGAPHSIPDGKGGYTTYPSGNANEGKQYRPDGKPHGEIDRPNVKEWKPNPNNPNGGKGPDIVRKPTSDEIPPEQREPDIPKPQNEEGQK